MSDGGDENCALEPGLVEREKIWKRTSTKEKRREKKKTRKRRKGTGKWKWRGCGNGSVNGNVSWTERAVQLHRV
jgi:hypothetical protein